MGCTVEQLEESLVEAQHLPQPPLHPPPSSPHPPLPHPTARARQHPTQAAVVAPCYTTHQQPWVWLPARRRLWASCLQVSLDLPHLLDH